MVFHIRLQMLEHVIGVRTWYTQSVGIILLAALRAVRA